MQLPQTLVDWSQLVSAVLSLLALGLALYAISKGKRDLIAERRTAHELDVLRFIAEALRSFGSTSFPQLMRTYLYILPGSEDFPIARAQFDIRATTTAKQRFEYVRDAAQPSRFDQYQSAQEFIEIYREELYTAIERRVSSDLYRSGRDRSSA